MQVEIVNPQGNVSYRRPHYHKDVKEALRRLGYSVRIPNCSDMNVLDQLPCQDGEDYRVVVSPKGLTVCSPVQYGRAVDPKRCDLMTVEEYLKGVACHLFTDDDGWGSPVKDNLEDSEICIRPSDGVLFIPSDATHVAWYNT